MTAVAAAVALLAACSVGEAPRPVPAPAGKSPRVVAPEWQAIPMDGEITDMDATYSQFLTLVGRTDDGAPLVAAVDGNHVRQVARKVLDDYGTGASSVTGDYYNTGFVQQQPPSLGHPARLYLGDLDAEFGKGQFEEWHRRVLEHPNGTAAPWASLLLDDEGGVRAITAVVERGAWRAHLWEVHPDDGRWRLNERGVPPRLEQEPGARSVVTSTEAFRTYLAESGDDGARLWSIDPDPYDPTRWRREQLDGGADSVTDILSWAIGSWVAGTRNGRVVIWDFDDGGGQVEVPEVEVDPEAPVVRLLRLPATTQAAFAAQRPDGPSVWVRGTSEWHELKAPAGTMTLAAATDQGFYLVIDDVLWFRPLAWDTVLP